MTLVVRTNHHVRDVLQAWDLTPAEREEFDYLDWKALEEGTDSATFVRYLGSTYDLGDTEGLAPGDLRVQGWDTYLTDSFWSGVLFRFHDAEGNLIDHGDGVVVGRFWQEG